MLSEKLKLLPTNPGCYLYRDKNGVIIYVGKAKNLKNRVKSYFTGAHNAKTTLLVQEIHDLEYIITKSELESLVLEINLIKQYDPKYNIKLTDGKTYPFIYLTNEAHPRVIATRNGYKGLGKKFGPYPNVTMARETVDVLNKMFPLRKCFNIPKKECLYYHIGSCLAPCIKNIEPNEYKDYLKQIETFLKGDVKEALVNLENKMNTYSENLEFEKAQECLETINSIKKTVEKQNIELRDFLDRDIFGFYADYEDICIHVFYMRHGAIVAHDASVFSLISDDVSMFKSFLIQFYQTHDLPKEILLPNIDIEGLTEVINGNIIVPQKADKLRLVNMAMDNAKLDLEKKRELIRNRVETKIKALDDLRDLLGIKKVRRMEIFDNSNIMGFNPVSAMVCYINGYPSKKDYRKYKVKSVEGPDDYNTMKEIVYRRYFRVLSENLERPDLIVMDGGINQVNACLEIINSLNLDIPVMGLRKDDSHKTDAIIFDNKEIPLDKHSKIYQMLFEMQEEVHRFAITFHIDTRKKKMVKSKLDDIAGVGPQRRKKLMMYFKSLDKLLLGTKEEFKKLGINEELMNHIKEEIGKKKN